MSRRRAGRRAQRLVAAAAFVCTLGACTDQADSLSQADQPPSVSASGGTSPISSASPTPSEPAGELIEVENVSLRAPVTWTVEYREGGVGQGMSLFPPSGAASNSISVYVSPNPSVYTLKDAEDFAIEEMRGVMDPDARRMPRTTLGGQPAFHVRGRDEVGHYDSFGAIYGAKSISIDFQLSGSKSERRSIIDEVLTSVEWK